MLLGGRLARTGPAVVVLLPRVGVHLGGLLTAYELASLGRPGPKVLLQIDVGRDVIDFAAKRFNVPTLLGHYAADRLSFVEGHWYPWGGYDPVHRELRCRPVRLH